MDDLFPIILFIIFFLIPLLEGLKKKNKKPPPPQQRRTPPRVQPRTHQPQRLPPSSRTEEVSTRPSQEETAATMVPDDLWEILTGQKRPPVMTTPQPLPPEEKQRPHWDVVYDPDEEDEAADEESLVRDAENPSWNARREPVSLETLERHAEPVIISLEDNIPTDAQRHAAFHDKVAAAPGPASVQRPRRTRMLGLNSRSEVQRAFLMAEIFGPPKGLE